MTIQTRSLTKTYLLKTALDSVSVTFADGKIHALVGENGAGKSTLAGLLSGDLHPTAGEILLDGIPVAFTSAKDALKAGIVLVHQRPLLAASLTAKENIILQRQATATRPPFFLRAPSAQLLALRDHWAPTLNLNTLIKDMGGNLRFYVSLLGALLQHPKVLILDEPSAFLDDAERRSLYDHLRTLSDAGTTIIVITHSRAQATTYAHTVTLLRHGKCAGQFTSADEYKEFLSEGGSLPPASHVGSFASAVAPTPPSPKGDTPLKSPAFTLTAVSSRPKNRPALLSATIAAEYGEITAVTGLQEAALDTLEDVATGMETAYAKGTVTLAAPDGTQTTLAARRLSPQVLRAHNTAIVPSDRAFRASHPAITVEQLLSVYTKGDPCATALTMIARAEVAITPEEQVSHLSGGMLQRLILTRELSGDPRLVILCNPLQGLDIQAQGELCQRLTALARAGKAILIIGAQEFPLSLCHKVYALESGRTHLRFDRAAHEGVTK